MGDCNRLKLGFFSLRGPFFCGLMPLRLSRHETDFGHRDREIPPNPPLSKGGSRREPKGNVRTEPEHKAPNAIDSTARDVIEGALVAWGTLDVSTFLQAGTQGGAVGIHDGSDRLMASVRRAASPVGWVWYVEVTGRRERVFPSVVTALRYLRGHLCPEREAGQVLFGAGESR